jgi:hypothetical protein
VIYDVDDQDRIVAVWAEHRRPRVSSLLREAAMRGIDAIDCDIDDVWRELTRTTSPSS